MARVPTIQYTRSEHTGKNSGVCNYRAGIKAYAQVFNSETNLQSESFHDGSMHEIHIMEHGTA